MDAKELRLGNIIKIGGSTIETYQTYKSVIITINILKAIQQENEERPEAILSVFQPIELTEEWLIKFGFKLFPWGYVGNGIRLQYTPIPKTFRYMSDNGKIKIEFVHQLQNLIYSLTGLELTIKE